MNATAQAQARTLPHVTVYGEAWTQAEVDMVLEFTDIETDEEIARTLGRTLYAVVAKQHQLRSGNVATCTVRQTGNQHRLPFDYGFTSVEAMFAGD